MFFATSCTFVAHEAATVEEAIVEDLWHQESDLCTELVNRKMTELNSQ